MLPQSVCQTFKKFSARNTRRCRQYNCALINQHRKPTKWEKLAVTHDPCYMRPGHRMILSFDTNSISWRTPELYTPADRHKCQCNSIYPRSGTIAPVHKIPSFRAHKDLLAGRQPPEYKPLEPNTPVAHACIDHRACSILVPYWAIGPERVAMGLVYLASNWLLDVRKQHRFAGLPSDLQSLSTS